MDDERMIRDRAGQWSNAWEYYLHGLTEPDVNLSADPAPIVHPQQTPSLYSLVLPTFG